MTNSEYGNIKKFYLNINSTYGLRPNNYDNLIKTL